MKNKEKSCWNCLYHAPAGINLLGMCKYFEKSGENKKDVPPKIVDVGCRFYEESNDFIKYLIKKTNGTFV